MPGKRNRKLNKLLSFVFFPGGLKELDKLLTKRAIFAPLDHSVIIEYKEKALNNQLMLNADNEVEKEEKKKDKEVILTLCMRSTGF